MKIYYTLDKNLLIIPLSVDMRLTFYNPFTITIITLKFVSPRKIITSINHLITRGALSPTTLFACEAHELYTFTRKFVGPPASQNTFPILTGRNGVYCTSAKENMKYSNQIALLRGTKNHLHCCFVF